MSPPTNPSGPAPPPGAPPPGEAPAGSAPMGRDLTELWGWLGIVVGLCCCGPLGVVFGVLSVREARRRGKSQILGYLAIGASTLNILFNVIRWLSGGPNIYRR